MTNHADKKCVFNNKLVTFRSVFYTVLLAKEWPFALLEWKKAALKFGKALLLHAKFIGLRIAKEIMAVFNFCVNYSLNMTNT